MELNSALIFAERSLVFSIGLFLIHAKLFTFNELFPKMFYKRENIFFISMNSDEIIAQMVAHCSLINAVTFLFK